MSEQKTDEVVTEIDLKQIKNKFIEQEINTNIIEQSIIDFKNGNMGLIDGKLSDLCFKALSTSLPKNSGFIPVFSLETLNLSKSRYSTIKDYAVESFENNKIKTNVLFIVSNQRSEMHNMQALIETKRMVESSNSGSIIVYDECDTDNSTMVNNWCKENDILYTQEMGVAIEKWINP